MEGAVGTTVGVDKRWEEEGEEEEGFPPSSEEVEDGEENEDWVEACARWTGVEKWGGVLDADGGLEDCRDVELAGYD